jgi:hypothetical protein
MRQGRLIAVCVTASAFSVWATPAFAYLGPGVGLSAIGAFLALIVGVVVAFFGFIWYPLRRLLRRTSTATASSNTPQQTLQAESVDKGE